MRLAYLSLGSNQGDRLRILHDATDTIGTLPGIVLNRVSPVYETDPVGYVDQPAFLNLVLEIRTDLEPHALLDCCQQVENVFGRVRTKRWGPRTLDVDILLIEETTVRSERLTVPHPRLHERAFVLVPLMDLGCHWIVNGATIPEWHDKVRKEEQGVRRFPADR